MMNRKPGQTAKDWQTAKVWVCAGTHAQHGPLWVCPESDGGLQHIYEEPVDGFPREESLLRALKELDRPLGPRPSPVNGIPFINKDTCWHLISCKGGCIEVQQIEAESYHGHGSGYTEYTATFVPPDRGGWRDVPLAQGGRSPDSAVLQLLDRLKAWRKDRQKEYQRMQELLQSIIPEEP